MVSKRCEGCSKLFDARRASRKWCSDSCSRRSRRRAVGQVEPAAAIAYPDISSAYPDMDAGWITYLHESLDFARVVNPNFVMPADRLAELLANLGNTDGSAAEESDWDLVEQTLVTSVLAGLNAAQPPWHDNDALKTELRALLDLWGDVFDPHVIAALAASLRDSDAADSNSPTRKA